MAIVQHRILLPGRTARQKQRGRVAVGEIRERERGCEGAEVPSGPVLASTVDMCEWSRGDDA